MTGCRTRLTLLDGWPSTMHGRPHTDTKYKDAYAPSGYDLLSILVRYIN
jgi:hypothetical protein